MESVVNSLLVLVLGLNFFLLGSSRLRAVIRGCAAQGFVLGLVAIGAHGSANLFAVGMAVVSIILKAFVIPRMLNRALLETNIRREVEPFVGYVPSLLIGAVGTGLAIVLAESLPLLPEHAESLLVPTSLSTVMIGFVILVSRKKALTQVSGYLVLENGVFLMGLSLVSAMPFMVELGVLLDLLVGVFVMGLIMSDFQREFGSLDTTRLSQLKD